MQSSAAIEVFIKYFNVIRSVNVLPRTIASCNEDSRTILHFHDGAKRERMKINDVRAANEMNKTVYFDGGKDKKRQSKRLFFTIDSLCHSFIFVFDVQCLFHDGGLSAGEGICKV